MTDVLDLLEKVFSPEVPKRKRRVFGPRNYPKNRKPRTPKYSKESKQLKTPKQKEPKVKLQRIPKYFKDVPNVTFDFENFKPIECKAHPGYFHVPGLPTVAVSRKGYVMNLLTDKVICQPRYDKIDIVRTGGVIDSSAKYQFVRIPANGKLASELATKPVHHLVLLAFKGPAPKELDFPIGNHLDGNKWNNSEDNLEWTDPSGNLVHAYKTNLRSDNVHVLAKNLRTGEEKEWYSFGDCAKFFRVHPERVFTWSLSPNKVYKKEWIFKRKDNPRPWPKINWYPGYTNERKAQSTPSDSKPVVAFNIYSNICAFTDSIKEMASIIGVHSVPLSLCLRKNGMHRTISGWIVKYKDDPRPLPHSIEEYDLAIKPKNIKAAQAYNRAGQYCIFAPSIAEIARMAGVDRNILIGRLKYGGIAKIGDWYFRKEDSKMELPYFKTWDSLQ